MNNSQLLLLIGLLTFDLLIAAIRAGVLNVRPGKLVSRKEAGERGVSRTIDLVTRRTRTRSSLKLAQALLRFFLAGVVLTGFIMPGEALLPSSTVIFVLVLTAILIWLLEFSIERVILRDPEKWAVRFTAPANFIITAVSPILALPLYFSRRGSPYNLVTITEDELIALVDASQRAGEIEKDEREMIHSVFQFGDTIAREIMVPRVDMLALDVNTPLKDAADVLLESGFSRVPVYENSIDNILGLLYTKDMLQLWRSGNGIDSLRALLRPANFVPESKKVDELLDEMQAARVHIAIVVDEYGGVEGVVTLEDIVEEIFGEIQDEYDEGEEAPYIQVAPGEYLCDGRVTLETINEVMDIHLPTDDAETLGGLIFTRAGGVPKPGDTFRETGALLTVEELNERRIHKVRVQRIRPDDQPPSGEELTSHAQ